MKKWLSMAMAMILLSCGSASASVILVGTTKVKIPNKYNKVYVEKYANLCLDDRLSTLQTDEAVRVASVACVNAVIIGTYPPK